MAAQLSQLSDSLRAAQERHGTVGATANPEGLRVLSEQLYEVRADVLAVRLAQVRAARGADVCGQEWGELEEDGGYTLYRCLLSVGHQGEHSGPGQEMATVIPEAVERLLDGVGHMAALTSRAERLTEQLRAEQVAHEATREGRDWLKGEVAETLARAERAEREVAETREAWGRAELVSKELRAELGRTRAQLVAALVPGARVVRGEDA